VCLKLFGLPFDAKYKIPLPPDKKKPLVQRKFIDFLWVVTAFVLPLDLPAFAWNFLGDGQSAKYLLNALAHE
jgi:hypothetical protein